jgi:hypothetical protein
MAPPVTIKHPAKLAEWVETMERNAAAATNVENQRAAIRYRINGKHVECRSTHTTKGGTYVLFYVDDRRTSRANLPTLLLPQ